MIQFYKPNPKVTGTACSFWLGKDGSIMASMIKQDSWNEAKKTGAFSKNKDNPQKRVIVKLSRIEIAGIIDAMERNVEFSQYHSSQNQVLQIKFCVYMDKQTQKQKGYSFSVNKQEKDDSTKKTGFIIGFLFSEARLLKHDLLGILTDSGYAQADAQAKSRETETSLPSSRLGDSPNKSARKEEQANTEEEESEGW